MARAPTVTIKGIAARADEGLWRRLAAGGQVVLRRHATTPGVAVALSHRRDPAHPGLRARGGRRLLLRPAAARAGPRRIKLILIATALLNAAAFHRSPFRSVARWDVAAGTPTWARLSAVVSLACWIGVIACGRLLAYL